MPKDPDPLTPEQQRVVDSEYAVTLLERERILRGHSIQQAAQSMNITVDRHSLLESGTATAARISNAEKIALRRYAHLDPALALSQNTTENRGKSGFANRF